jgi:dsDNA-specific endonuclease/ATPase MutS2
MASRDEPHPAMPEEPYVVPIEDVLDLHPFQPREILDVVDAYLDAALERGLREVRLIHGRGKGVQRARIQGMLQGDARVRGWQDAPPTRGGWGATLVWLDPDRASRETADAPQRADTAQRGGPPPAPRVDPAEGG